jgi:ferrochelatase
MKHNKIGVFVMSYGTPPSLEDVEAYYTHIRRGRPPEPEQLQELKDRYEAIGGLFPLRANTNRQSEALQEALDKVEPGRFVCYQGLKHTVPLIEDGIEEMVKDGITRAIGIVLAPHYSIMSVGTYIKRAQAEAEKHQIKLNCVQSYHLHPLLLKALTERVDETIQSFDTIKKQDIHVIFSAHSLPEKIVEMKDPYPEQLLETSQAIADTLGITDWQFSWQSAGQTGVPWLGPDILETLEEIHSEKKHVLICPIGFVSDHLEVLYDIDIECQQKAQELGITLKRTRSLNDDPAYIATLADCVIKQLVELDK